MASGEEYKLTEEDIEKFDGEGMCLNLEDCNHKLNSKVCDLVRGYAHPQCPVNIEVHNDLLKDQDFIKMQESIHELAVHAMQLWEKIKVRKKEREGKKTE